jgi:hypothetical protein
MTDALTDDALHVLDGVEISGTTINTSEDELIDNVKHSIRLGHPQVRPQPIQPERVCLIGGGPSLNDTVDELRDLYFAGAKVVTVNGSYQWCLERNIRPSAQIVLDAQAHNARFLHPAVPQCRYLLASQCHAETWQAVDGRPDVYIWHGAASDNPHLKPILDAYYGGNWTSTPGGTTVIVRALLLLRILGFLRFDVFGWDSCLMDGQHHAYDQPQNDRDGMQSVTISRNGEQARTFLCAPWMIKQLECALQTIRLHGHNFLLNVHGDGMIAYALQIGADGADIGES